MNYFEKHGSLSKLICKLSLFSTQLSNSCLKGTELSQSARPVTYFMENVIINDGRNTLRQLQFEKFPLHHFLKVQVAQEVNTTVI